MRFLLLTLRGRNVILNVFEMWIAFAGIVSGIVFFYSPASIDRNAISQTIGHDLSLAWIIGYFAAGLVIWYGLLRPSPRWEVVGLFILGSATSINGIAILSIFGMRGVATAATLLTLTVAAWIRAVMVMQATLRLARENNDAAPG